MRSDLDAMEQTSNSTRAGHPMVSVYSYGNDPAKVAGYRAFWDRAPVKRPLVSSLAEVETLRPVLGM